MAKKVSTQTIFHLIVILFKFYVFNRMGTLGPQHNYRIHICICMYYVCIMCSHFILQHFVGFHFENSPRSVFKYEEFDKIFSYPLYYLLFIETRTCVPSTFQAFFVTAIAISVTLKKEKKPIETNENDAVIQRHSGFELSNVYW